MIAKEVVAGSKILVVDDYDTDRLLFQEFVQASGYQVILATDGREALRILLDNPNLALLMTDINMPDLDGIDLLKHVRYARPHIPIIVTSADPRILENTALQALDINITLTKPANPETIKAVTQQALGGGYYTEELLGYLRELVLETMNDKDPALSVTPEGKPYLRHGPELLGDLSVVVGVSGQHLRGTVILSGPTIWWNRLTRSVYGKKITNSNALFDCSGEFGNQITTKVREYYLRRGIESQQTPQMVFRGSKVELLSQYRQPILTLPFIAVGMTDPFYLEVQIAHRGEESKVEIEIQDDGELDLF
ncbi:MAG: response regulator [Myxococcota bacterium]|nr:response regulator [Myxococcota bacterium]